MIILITQGGWGSGIGKLDYVICLSNLPWSRGNFNPCIVKKKISKQGAYGFIVWTLVGVSRFFRGVLDFIVILNN